jgi:D-cysteine desulfhydrase family pyridoxal phosphate-dependent enzyme
MLLDRLPRVKLAHLPTPVEELTSLSALLGGPRLFMKRDDCTGLATGGNKTRKLEYLVGDAQAQGADTLITEGGLQSNHCRQTAAAARRVGMDCVLVLQRGYAGEITGNLLLDQIFGARLILVDDSAGRAAEITRAEAELKAQGRSPYVIPTGGSNGVGALGYANCMREIGDDFDVIVTASGSGGTQGGLVLGRKLFESPTKIVGISDGEPRAELAEMVLHVAREGAAVLEASLEFSDDDINIYDEYYGEGYGIPTPEMVDAVRTVARTEGILLDPVYSGKAMAGLIDLIKQDVFESDQKVLFIHTGGTPALFAYRETFSE